VESFQTIYQRAAERKGGEKALLAMLGKPRTNNVLKKIPDDRYLAEMTKKVFQSGFVWRVVENKWKNFEEVFFQFNIDKILMMPPEMVERKASDERIIRNLRKVKTIQNNALFISDIRREYGGFGQWLNEFSSEKITDLWLALKQRGDRLGGNTGPYFLRTVGKDTFLLSRDVEAYFRTRDLISGGLTTKNSLTKIQDVFNHWADESGMSMQQLSQIVAFSIGDNYL